MFFFGVCILLDRWNLFNLWNCMRKPAFEFLLSYVIKEYHKQTTVTVYISRYVNEEESRVCGRRTIYFSCLSLLSTFSQKNLKSEVSFPSSSSLHKVLERALGTQYTIMEKGTGYTDCHPLMIIKRKGHNLHLQFTFSVSILRKY